MRARKTLATAFMLLSMSAGGVAAQEKRVAISAIVEVPQLMETKAGVLKGLAERGYVEGKNLSVQYQSADGNMGTQQQIARKFVADQPDVIIPITTPTAQTMVAATKKVPIVFAAVIDPVKAKIIKEYKAPGGNVTGVSDRPPIAKQVELIKEILPDLKRLGYLYNPGLDSSLATLEWIKEEAAKRGIEIVETAAPTTNEVITAARSLVGKAEAIYVPNDTTVVAALESVIKIGQDTSRPIFTGETRGVERGALASIGLNYTEVGRLAGHLAADVLDGKMPEHIEAVIAYEKLADFTLFVNRTAAKKMGVTVPQTVLTRATRVIE